MLVLGAALAGCGGGDDNNGSTGGDAGATNRLGDAGDDKGGSTGSEAGATNRLGDAARITNTGTDWWVNVRQGTYYFSVTLKNSYEDDMVGKAAALDFAKVIGGKVGAGKAVASIATLVPASNEVAGWSFDPDNAKTASAPAVATTKQQAVDLIDGSAEPFYATGYQAVAFAWANYVKDTYNLELYVWQMASAADVTKLYVDLLQNPLYAAPTWTNL
jgi:hypothetical protein